MPDPASLPSGRAPLHIRLSLSRADSGAIPARLSMDSVWFAMADHRGKGRVDEVKASRVSLAGAVWGGPSWLMKAESLDVAVRIRRGAQSFCVRAPRVPLARTE